MKTLLITALGLGSVAAFGPSGALLSNQVTPLPIADHPQPTSYAHMASENPLVGRSADAYSECSALRATTVGVRPGVGAGFASDVACAQRKDRVANQKAGVVFEKQAS
jgi:hypothetical protein